MPQCTPPLIAAQEPHWMIYTTPNCCSTAISDGFSKEAGPHLFDTSGSLIHSLRNIRHADQSKGLQSASNIKWQLHPKQSFFFKVNLPKEISWELKEKTQALPSLPMCEMPWHGLLPSPILSVLILLQAHWVHHRPSIFCPNQHAQIDPLGNRSPKRFTFCGRSQDWKSSLWRILVWSKLQQGQGWPPQSLGYYNTLLSPHVQGQQSLWRHFRGPNVKVLGHTRAHIEKSQSPSKDHAEGVCHNTRDHVKRIQYYTNDHIEGAGHHSWAPCLVSSL